MNGWGNRKSTREFAADAGKPSSWQCGGKRGQGLIVHGAETPQSHADSLTAEMPLRTCNSAGTPRQRNAGFGSETGASFPELMIVCAISLIMTAITVPSVRTAFSSYQLRQAAVSASMAIQTVRYQAVMMGYPYAITFDKTTKSYQVSKKPTGAGAFSNVGGAVLLAPNVPITLSAQTTLQFSPNGTVTATLGAMSFTITNSSGTKTVAVAQAGAVTVTP